MATLWYTSKAYNFSEIEQASFVVKGYDPLGKLPILSVSAFIENSSIEKFLSSRVGAVITYQDTFNGNALIYDTTHSLNFLSLSPEIASVDTFGNVVGVNEGSAEIVVSRRSVADTITVTVLPATLVPDSVVISRDTVKLLANDTVSIKATGYFHDSNGAFTRSITNDVIWFSANTSVATVTDGLVTGIVAGGPVNITASLSGVADTCFFTILPRPDYLKRINFKTDTIPHAVGWRADDGRIYSAAKAMGWLTSTSTTTRGDRDSGILLGTIVSKSTETEFKIDAPDGEYILKIGVGDNKYGGLCTVTHGGELIVNHSAVANAIVVDTITVTNNTGIVLGIYGKICYIVAISSQDIPIDMVADDGNLRLISPVPPSTGAEEFSETAGSTLRVYPNPFNPVVNIQFPFIKTSRTNKLAIFDMRGRLVHSATFNSNVRTFAWNASDKESGLYIVKVSNGTREFSSGIVLMK